VNALDGEKIFDQSDPEFNYEIVQGELFNLDELTGVLVREEGEAVGSYQILIGDLSAGSNYSIDFNPGTFTILGRLTISSTEGGEVILPGEGIFTYSEPAEVSIIAEPVDPYHFSYWSGDTDNLSATDSSEITVLVDGDYAYTANFELSNAVETLSDDLFVIYPNPARQYVNIYLDQKASLSHSYKYQLFDMQGRLLEQGHISENNNRIGIEKYDTPMLLLKIQLGDQLIKSTIIIKE
jgi:hypothetical protein